VHQGGFQPSMNRTSAPRWFHNVYNIEVIEYLFEKNYNLELNKSKIRKLEFNNGICGS
jgi:hypothetical protein